MPDTERRTWVRLNGVKAWKSSDGRLITWTGARRMGRNGRRKAGYELSTGQSGALRFYLKLTDAKNAE